MTRLHILLGVAALLLVAVLWNWISGWGLVTIDASGHPISKVIDSIERQGNVRITTNVDPSTPVSIHVVKVPPAEALDTVADWLDGDWSVTYVAGASKAEVTTALLSLSEDTGMEHYQRFSSGGGRGFMGSSLAMATDPRKIEWNVSPTDDGELWSYLDQFAQKTGASALIPEEWNPPVTGMPKGGKASTAIRNLIDSVNGEVEEVFVLRVWDRDRGDRTAQTASNRRGSPGTRGGRDRRQSNPEWIAERMEQQIAQLPAEEQKEARADFEEMRSFWQKMQELPEEERRDAARAFFEDPARQEKMMERGDARNDRRSPERRAERYRDYIERKKSIKQSL